MGCHDAASSSDGEHKKSNSLWYVGVILSVTGSIATNLGVNLQKYSFMCEAKRSIKLKRAYSRQPMWVIGLMLVVGGSLLDFVALGFLPQSLATPVGGTTMVANVAFASLFLKEKFSRMDAIGTGLVLVGICIVAAFAEKESACYTVDELVALYQEPFFVVYIVIVLLACAGLYLLTKKLERLLKNQGSSSVAYKKFARVHPVTYPALSGVFGAQSVLFAKSVAELFKTTLEGTNQFTNFGTYLISLSMLACIFLQIHWLAHGLQMFDAVFVVPVFQCFFISTSIFGGGVYFKEFAKMPTLSLVMFFLGAAVTLSGVYLLSRREMNVLKPSGKLRAAVKMIIFIKRTQKARNIEYRWVQPSTKRDLLLQTAPKATDMLTKGPPELAIVKPLPLPLVTGPRVVTLPPLVGVKISKASVMPIDSNYPPAPSMARADHTQTSSESTALDLSSNSQIHITPKRFDK